MAFEVFSRKTQYKGSPSVTFTALGRLAFNKAATITFQKEKVENVILMWDKEKRLIGLQPITGKDSRSYKIRYNKRGDGSGFSATTFIKYIGYNASGTQSIDIEWDEEGKMFIVEVPEEYIKQPQRIRLKRRQSSEEGKGASA
jgi:hypothetical protein